MIVTNGIHPRRREGGDTTGSDSDGPFIAISLLKFKRRAEYADDPACTLSGAEAYGLYAAAVGDRLAAVGARLVYLGDIAGIDVGEVEEPWDMAAVVEYPSLAAVQTLMMMPEYQAIIRHRKAGLAGQLSLRVHALER